MIQSTFRMFKARKQTKAMKEVAVKAVVGGKKKAPPLAECVGWTVCFYEEEDDGTETKIRGTVVAITKEGKIKIQWEDNKVDSWNREDTDIEWESPPKKKKD